MLNSCMRVHGAMNNQDQEKLCQVALSLVEGVGTTLWKKLIAQFGSAQAVFQSSAKSLIRIPGSSRRLAAAILKKDTLSTAEALLIAHQRASIEIISFYDAAYPERLRHTTDAPPLLYFRGNTNLNATRIISIVGTRKATAYGRQMVEKLISELCAYHVLIVSGLAYGIDICAHREALKYGLPTLTVLAGDSGTIYPSMHKKVALAMLAQGGILSEHPLGTVLETHQFPARNRIIAGIADATVVIEAGDKSGALITADCANAYDREVFAVPGSIYDASSSGCNYLIKTQQAHLITDAGDIAYIMNWDTDTNALRPSDPMLKKLPQLTTQEQGAVQALKKLHKAVHIDELSYQASIPLNQLPSIMLQLELKNVVKFLPGNKFRLAAA
ncbi:MAG: DNA-processing protein DprA [Bacteroidota bacterium]